MTAIKKVTCVHVRVYLRMYTHAHAFIKAEKYTPNVNSGVMGDVYIVLSDSLNLPMIIHIHIFITEKTTTNLSKLCYASMVSSVL